MGCQSGKVSAAQTSASKAAPVDQHTLLTTPAAQQNFKQDVLQMEAGAGKVSAAPSASSVDAAKVAEGARRVLQQAGEAGTFNGTWSSGAVISHTKSRVTWFDGTESSVQINDMARKIEVSYHGDTFTGELQDDDCIHWSDGDVWSREQESREPNTMSADVGATSQLEEGPNSTSTNVAKPSQQDVNPAAAKDVAEQTARLSMHVDCHGEPTAMVPAKGQGDIEPAVGKNAEEPPAIWADSKPPKQVESWSDTKAGAAQSKEPSRMDRISIDTADLDLPIGVTGGLQASSGKTACAKPRKERSLCCC